MTETETETRFDLPDDVQRFVYNDGDEYWYKNGILHREDGPAVIRLNDSKIWYKNGVYHREDGPAIIREHGSEEWWINGKFLKNSKYDDQKLFKNMKMNIKDGL